MLIFKNLIFLLISFNFKGAFPLQQSPQNMQPSFVSPWSFVPGVSVGTQELAGLGAGQSLYSRAWTVGLELLCPGWSCCLMRFLVAVSRRGLQKVTKN